ncbi:hypothetical protein GYMLUDRAFT_77894 [Collybiopsis luxurians FD-317 M1]|uniref:Uncharacterized protein n=1 Tax=Collybiopsis luxurians FD-317 M1 TaxID=944289 RepID=A0A0D0C394_9AGAR|nr:hypothetical protein GYMLUDRAFT_77894 [Collybiopsis luxurians FD-317 M1]
MLSLPDELLQNIVEIGAYLPQPMDYMPPEFDDHPEIGSKRPSSELRSLSLVNRRIRQICLPLLFAYLRISRHSSAKKFYEEHCLVPSPCPKLTRMLSLYGWCFRNRSDADMICRLLPFLEGVTSVRVELPEDEHLDAAILQSFQQHPTLTIVVNARAPSFYSLDRWVSLSVLNVVVEQFYFSYNTLSFRADVSRTYGAFELKRVTFYNHEFPLENSLPLPQFNGLSELTLFIDSRGPTAFSWLASFMSAHPQLRKLWIRNDSSGMHNLFDTPSFLRPLVEHFAFREQRRFGISSLGLSKIATGSSQEWHVTGLTLVAKLHWILNNSLLLETLSLVSSSFPAVELLALNLANYQEIVPIDQFAAVLARFSFLRVLHLYDIFKQFSFDRGGNLEVQREVNMNDQHEVGAAVTKNNVLRCTSCIAKEVPSLEAFYVSEQFYGVDNQLHKGWLYVVGAERKAEGELKKVIQ